jgi:hypothetical protein
MLRANRVSVLLMPSADWGPAPTPRSDNPNPRRPMVPGSFRSHGNLTVGEREGGTSVPGITRDDDSREQPIR